MKQQRVLVFTIPKLFGPLPQSGVQRNLDFYNHAAKSSDSKTESLTYLLKTLVNPYQHYALRVSQGKNLVNLQKNALTDRMIRFDLGIEGFSIDLGILKHNVRSEAGIELKWSDPKTLDKMDLSLLNDSHQNPSFYYVGFNYPVQS